MTNYKTIAQDITSTLLVFALMGTAIEAKLQPLVSSKTFSIIDLILGAAMLLAYYADAIFGFTPPVVPPAPVLPTPTVPPTVI